MDKCTIPLAHTMALIRLVLISSFAWLIAMPLYAAESPNQAVQTAVSTFLDSYDFDTRYPVEYTVKRLDSRLRMKPCESPLQARFRDDRRTTGNTHIQVECLSDTPWRMHVAVTVRVWTDAVVAKRPIARGAAIATQDLRYLKVERSRLYQGHYQNIEEVAGLSAAMPIRNDQIINARHLRAPYLVNKGQRVTILALSGNMAIRARGMALANASRGQSVTVKNIDSGRVIDGIAVDEGTVQVPL